jgi:hypothetical protein
LRTADINAVQTLTKDNPRQQGGFQTCGKFSKSGWRIDSIERALGEPLSRPKEIQSQADHRRILGLIDRMAQEEASSMTAWVAFKIVCAVELPASHLPAFFGGKLTDIIRH